MNLTNISVVDKEAWLCSERMTEHRSLIVMTPDRVDQSVREMCFSRAQAHASSAGGSGRTHPSGKALPSGWSAGTRNMSHSLLEGKKG